MLGLERVGVDDAFFDLGGTSLFQAPTPAGLAAKLAEAGTDDGAGNDAALRVLLPLRATGDRTPLFAFHPAGGISWCYRSGGSAPSLQGGGEAAFPA